MECDSVHSNIEKALKNTTANLPSDYIQIIQSARKSKHRKYRVKYVDFTFLKDYKETSDIKSIKPSTETGYPYVISMRQLLYKPDGTTKVYLRRKRMGKTSLQDNLDTTSSTTNVHRHKVQTFTGNQGDHTEGSSLFLRQFGSSWRILLRHLYFLKFYFCTYIIIFCNILLDQVL